MASAPIQKIRGKRPGAPDGKGLVLRLLNLKAKRNKYFPFNDAN